MFNPSEAALGGTETGWLGTASTSVTFGRDHNLKNNDEVIYNKGAAANEAFADLVPGKHYFVTRIDARTI
jgi:hypothetical protein